MKCYVIVQRSLKLLFEEEIITDNKNDFLLKNSKVKNFELTRNFEQKKIKLF